MRLDLVPLHKIRKHFRKLRKKRLADHRPLGKHILQTFPHGFLFGRRHRKATGVHVPSAAQENHLRATRRHERNIVVLPSRECRQNFLFPDTAAPGDKARELIDDISRPVLEKIIPIGRIGRVIQLHDAPKPKPISDGRPSEDVGQRRKNLRIGNRAFRILLDIVVDRLQKRRIAPDVIAMNIHSAPAKDAHLGNLGNERPIRHVKRLAKTCLPFLMKRGNRFFIADFEAVRKLSPQHLFAHLGFRETSPARITSAETVAILRGQETDFLLARNFLGQSFHVRIQIIHRQNFRKRPEPRLDARAFFLRFVRAIRIPHDYSSFRLSVMRRGRIQQKPRLLFVSHRGQIPQKAAVLFADCLLDFLFPQHPIAVAIHRNQAENRIPRRLRSLQKKIDTASLQLANPLSRDTVFCADFLQSLPFAPKPQHLTETSRPQQFQIKEMPTIRLQIRAAKPSSEMKQRLSQRRVRPIFAKNFLRPADEIRDLLLFPRLRRKRILAVLFLIQLQKKSERLLLCGRRKTPRDILDLRNGTMS